MKQMIFKSSLFCALILLTAVSAQAADVYQATTMAINRTWTDVNDGAATPANYFSDGQAAHAGVDYFVGRLRDGSIPPGQTATVTLRSPSTGIDATFPGDSLTVDTQGSLSYKQSGSTHKLTVNNLKVIGTGALGNAQPNSTCTLYGDLTIHGTPSIGMSGTTDFRNMTIYALFAGDGTVSMNGDGTWTPAFVKRFMLSNDNNTYSGNINVSNALFIVDTPKSVYTVAKITLNKSAQLQPNVDVLAPNTDLVVTVDAQILLGKNINLKSCTINGTALADGVHTAATLAATYAANVVNNGGSITVGVPPIIPNKVNKSWLFE